MFYLLTNMNYPQMLQYYNVMVAVIFSCNILALNNAQVVRRVTVLRI